MGDDDAEKTFEGEWGKAKIHADGSATAETKAGKVEIGEGGFTRVRIFVKSLSFGTLSKMAYEKPTHPLNQIDKASKGILDPSLALESIEVLNSWRVAHR